MIEREARFQGDREKVARVIYNRLAKGMRLQIDATVQYALGKTKPQLTFHDLKVESPYNTYLHAGLPPTPIASPGLASLRAALTPAKGPWLYYLVVDAAGHEFFTDSYDAFSTKESAKCRARSAAVGQAQSGGCRELPLEKPTSGRTDVPGLHRTCRFARGGRPGRTRLPLCVGRRPCFGLASRDRGDGWRWLAWARLNELGLMERGFVSMEHENVDLQQGSGLHGARHHGPGVRPGILLDRLEQALQLAAESRTRQEGMSPVPGVLPRWRRPRPRNRRALRARSACPCTGRRRAPLPSPR